MRATKLHKGVIGHPRPASSIFTEVDAPPPKRACPSSRTAPKTIEEACVAWDRTSGDFLTTVVHGGPSSFILFSRLNDYFCDYDTRDCHVQRFTAECKNVERSCIQLTPTSPVTINVPYVMNRGRGTWCRHVAQVNWNASNPVVLECMRHVNQLPHSNAMLLATTNELAHLDPRQTQLPEYRPCVPSHPMTSTSQRRCKSTRVPSLSSKVPRPLHHYHTGPVSVQVWVRLDVAATRVCRERQADAMRCDLLNATGIPIAPVLDIIDDYVFGLCHLLEHEPIIRALPSHSEALLAAE